MSEKRKNPTRIIAIAAGTNEVYDAMHREAKKEGLTLKAFILKRCLGIKPEPRGKETKESKPKVTKAKAKASAQPSA
jgi:hypothetical protein